MHANVRYLVALIFSPAHFFLPQQIYQAVIFTIYFLISCVPGTRTYNLEERKKFFDELAKAKGFDPLAPENWFSIDSEQIASQKVK
jgi:hypothetical protein